MGDTSTSVIVRMADLEADGKEINVPLVNQLSGDGVGAGTLRGNEEALDSYGFPVWADLGRNAVANNRASNKESSFNVRSTARDLLSGWGRRIVRDDIVDTLLSIPTSSVQPGRLQAPGNRVNGIRWSAATTAQKNSWTAANFDRILFGGARQLLAGVCHRDCQRGRFNHRLAKRHHDGGHRLAAKQLAKQSGTTPANPGFYNGRPKITPWEIEELDEELYVCFVGDRASQGIAIRSRDVRGQP